MGATRLFQRSQAGFHQVDGALVAYAKGAPGHILARCTRLIMAAAAVTFTTILRFRETYRAPFIGSPAAATVYA